MAKVRHGFVSNSSSSSFIIGAGVAPSKDWLEKNKNILADSDFTVLTVKDLKEGASPRYGCYNYGQCSETLTVESFQSEITISLHEYEDTDTVVIFDGGSSVSEQDMFEDEDYYDYKTDLELELFSLEDQSKVYLMAELENNTISWGCGRDG